MFNIVRPILYCELETVTGSNCIFCIRKGITITMDVSKQSMMSKFASSFMYYFGMVSISIKKTAYKKREISYFIFDMYISKVNYHYSIAIFYVWALWIQILISMVGFLSAQTTNSEHVTTNQRFATEYCEVYGCNPLKAVTAVRYCRICIRGHNHRGEQDNQG